MTNRRATAAELFDYLRWVFGPFFRWWWAALTGITSFFAILVTPKAGLTLDEPGVFLLTAGISLLVFLCASATAQGAILYFKRYPMLRVQSARKGTEFGSDLLFIIEGRLADHSGALLEIRRVLDNAELPFCIVKVINTTEDGRFQAATVWASPGHLRAFSKRKFEVRDLRVSPMMTHDRIIEAFNVTQQ